MKIIFVLFINFFSVAATAGNPLLACLKAAGYDEIQTAAELGDPSCSAQYTNPLFDGLAGGIVLLSAGGSPSFQSAGACSQLPYQTAGSMIAALLLKVVPGLSTNVQNKLHQIADGTSQALISEVLPASVLNSFLLPWNCACRFASLKSDFLAVANDTAQCANLFGTAIEDFGEWVQGLNGPVWKTSGCVQCADVPVYVCADSLYPVDGKKCACQAPRVFDAATQTCGCPGNAFYQANAKTPGTCIKCTSGLISNKTCQDGASGCGVSCGPGKGDPGACQCICPEHSQLNNDKKSCGCFGGYDPDTTKHTCVCNPPKVVKGANGMYCELPSCPGMQSRGFDGECACPAGMTISPGTQYACACISGKLSKDKICCQQLAPDGTCITTAPGSSAQGSNQCPPGQFFKTSGLQVKGVCTACPPGQVANAAQTECVPAPAPSLRSVVAPK